jgi:glycerol transport system ATP-binding protein
VARIEFRDLGHSYGAADGGPQPYALQPMNQTWRDGGAYALLGPSGCGKTTLLNIISGLIHPSEGRVLFDGTDVTELPTERRNIAQVFQFPVIYDTMTVFDNLAFPLRNRRVPEEEVKRRVEQVAEMLELTSDLRRRASGLAADAKQKISLGRGLVRSDVAAILFDEPLTVIDPHLKWILRRKLKQIHQELKLTLIYVTHDQTEALTFADEVIVMHDGRILQSATPQELFEHPAHSFVGHFVGSPGMNLLSCELNGSDAVIADRRIGLDPAYAARASAAKGMPTLGIRPEFIRCSPSQVPGSVAAEVIDIEERGNSRILTALLGDRKVKVKVGEDFAASRGPAWLSFPVEWTRIYVGDVVVT